MMDEKTYYERYWTRKPVHTDGWMQQQDPWDAACLQRVIETARPVLRGEVLDAGCGNGTVIEAIASLPEITRITGVDVSEAAVEQARTRVPTVRLAAMNLDRLEFADQSFDTVLAIEVVEHLLDVEAVFAEMARVIKPGGHLVITTTDFNWPKKVLVAALFFDRYFHPLNPHVRFFTRRTLRHELERAGFQERVHRWNGSYAGLMPKGQIMIAQRVIGHDPR